MSKFNPEDFKVDQAPLSNVTVNGESVIWDQRSGNELVTCIHEGQIILNVRTSDALFRTEYDSAEALYKDGDILVDFDALDAMIAAREEAEDEAYYAEEAVKAAKEMAESEDDAPVLYYIESTCDGCGAPMGASKCTEAQYLGYSNRGSEFRDLTECELELFGITLNTDAPIRVAYRHRSCTQCGY